MQLALAGSMVGDWAYATAVTVWAFEVGGTKAVGLWGAVRFTLMAIVAPLAATLSDRLPRKLVMISVDLLRAGVVVVAAACIHFETPAWPVFILATATSLLGSVFRPAQMALVPSIAETPEDLVASNGASSAIESLAFFLGPALGAFLVANFEVAVVFLVNATTFVLSAVLVLGIRLRSTEPTPDTSDVTAADGPSPRALSEMAAGFTTIWRDRDLLTVTFLTCIQTLVAGASMVLSVVFALDILESGAEGVGYVDSVFGVGAILGGFFAIARSRRRSLATDLGVGVVMWSLPLVLLALWTSPVAMFVAVAVMGFGNPLVDVNYATLTQRLAPEKVLGRVFGAGEGALIATMAVGSAITPFLVNELGLRPTLTALGLVVAVPTLLLLGRCRRLDTRLVPPVGLELLTAIPMFRPLGPARLETLARQMERVSVLPGEVVVGEGEEPDRFYVIASGAVDVSRGTEVIRRLTAGDFFGEIGLLRDVPRTATVTGTEDTVLMSLGRAEFLEAVTGEDESRVAAEAIVSRRIAV
jgi:MFS family permease